MQLDCAYWSLKNDDLKLVILIFYLMFRYPLYVGKRN